MQWLLRGLWIGLLIVDKGESLIKKDFKIKNLVMNFVYLHWKDQEIHLKAKGQLSLISAMIAYFYCY